MIPGLELQQSYDDMLQALENEVERERKIVTGWKGIANALNIYSKKRIKKSKIDESDRKKFSRIAKKCGFPIHRSGRRIYMFQKDIDTINEEYLLSMNLIAKHYLHVHVNTLRKLLKRYPKMPIDTKRGIAYKPALNLWSAVLCFDRLKRGHPIPRFIRKNTPVYEGINHVFYAMAEMRFYHPKEFYKYWLSPEDDILRAS